MAITYVNSGAAVDTTSTTLSPHAPTINAYDLLIANLHTHDNTAITGQDARWKAIATATNNTTAERYTTYWMIAAAADSAATFNFTIAGTTHGLGRISAYRGASGVGVSSISANASSATVTWAARNPTLDQNVLVAIFGGADATMTDGGMDAVTGQPTFTNRYFSAGTTDVIALYDAIPTNGQPNGARTMGATNAAVSIGVMFELLVIPTGNQGSSSSTPGAYVGTSSPADGTVNFPRISRSANYRQY